MSTTGRKAVFLEGSITSHLFKMTFPVIIGMLCSFSFVICDTYFISILGTDKLAAISYCIPVIDLLIGIGIGIGIAISSVTARKIGQHKYDEVSAYLFYSMLFSILLGLILSIIGILSIQNLFIHLGVKSPLILIDIESFMHIWYFTVPLMFLSFTAFNALRANGKAKQAAYLQIFMAGLNLCLDILFIFHFKQGIRGAAEADIITRLCVTIIGIILLVRIDLITFHTLTAIKKVLKSWLEMISIMIPGALTNSIPAIAAAWSIKLIANYSSFAVAGYGAGSKIQLIALIPLLALSASVGPIIGQNFSANKINRAYITLKQSCWFAIIWGLVSAFILYLMSYPLAKLFSANSETILITVEYLTMIPICYAAWGVIMIVCANFNALGKPIRSTLISTTRLIVIFIPLSYLLFHFLGYKGIFIAWSGATILVAIIAYVWAVRYFKKNMLA